MSTPFSCDHQALFVPDSLRVPSLVFCSFLWDILGWSHWMKLYLNRSCLQSLHFFNILTSSLTILPLTHSVLATVARFNLGLCTGCSLFSLTPNWLITHLPWHLTQMSTFQTPALLTTSFKLNPSLTQHSLIPLSLFLLLYLLDPEQCLIQRR